jgi:hypothetical protein
MKVEIPDEIAEKLAKILPHKGITQEEDAKLRAPLPPAAFTVNRQHMHLTSIKAIFVIERLNDVFGIGGWRVTDEVVEKTGNWVVIKSTLTVPGRDIVISCFGGNDAPDRGDAYKGAATDALTKIGSYLMIGAAVWKGEVMPVDFRSRSEERENKQDVPQDLRAVVPDSTPTTNANSHETAPEREAIPFNDNQARGERRPAYSNPRSLRSFGQNNARTGSTQTQNGSVPSGNMAPPSGNRSESPRASRDLVDDLFAVGNAKGVSIKAVCGKMGKAIRDLSADEVEGLIRDIESGNIQPQNGSR